MDLNSNIKNKKGIVFSGGGIFGISYVGSISELIEKGYKFKYFVGSSIGALFATLMACKMNIKDMYTFAMDLDLTQMKDNSNFVTGLHRLYNEYGWYSQDYYKQMIEQILYKITNKHDITFSDIKTLYGSHLAIISTSVKTGKLEIFDIENSPDMKVCDACTYSGCIPFFFGTKGYLDGGLKNNYPIDYMNDLIGSDKTLGLKFKHDCDEKIINITGLESFTIFVVNTLIDSALRVHLSKEDKKNTICIETLSHLSFIDFDLTKEDKTILIENGKQAVIKYLSK